jgi:hypothetical protein
MGMSIPAAALGSILPMVQRQRHVRKHCAGRLLQATGIDQRGGTGD